MEKKFTLPGRPKKRLFIGMLALTTVLASVVLPGKVLPILYCFFVTAACYFLIEWNERKWHIRFATMKGKKLVIFTVAVWVATIAIAGFAEVEITAA